MTDLSMPALALPRDRAPTALRVGDVFSRSLKIFAAHWIAYCGMMAVGYAPIAAVMAAATAAVATGSMHGMQGHNVAIIALALIVMIGLLASLLLAPAAISFGAAQDMSGRGFSMSPSLRMALRRSPAILGLTILIVLYGMFGLILLIIPGLIIFCVYSVAIPACIIEGLGPIKSMSRSAFLTKGNRWRVFGILCVLYIGSAMLEKLVSLVPLRVDGVTIFHILSLPFDIFVGAFSAVALGVLYTQLRVAREGADVEHIAKVFD
ncbi:hypothetical protein [Methylocapsa sp. S129]|uniref:hypothetical protein n=1 Tax=Methylocapsa sp. S129 TaxID=1641869 RepID=UPI00131D185C|nr:hypothetical protein [Methylocapsa sp. S129]